MRRSLELDGLRAMAALAVLATHAAGATAYTTKGALGPLFARLNVGVTLFFVLSAFLLYRPWVKARLTEGPAPSPSLGRYAARRAARILPAYWAALLILGLLLPAWVPGALGHHWWAYFGLLQVYGRDTIAHGIGQAWSLSTEVAFYVTLPLFAWATGRLLSGRDPEQQVRWELGLLAVSALAAFVLRGIAQRHGWLFTYGNTLAGDWGWFAIGLGLAVLSVRVPRGTLRWPWAWWVAAAAILGVSAWGGLLPRNVFTETPAQLQREHALFAAIALCVFVPLVFADGGPRRLLSLRVPVFLGTISYGIFLWHYALIGWVIGHVSSRPLVVGPLSLALTVAVATASWYVLERPVMRWVAERTSRRPDRERAAGPSALEPAP